VREEYTVLRNHAEGALNNLDDLENGCTMLLQPRNGQGDLGFQ